MTEIVTVEINSDIKARLEHLARITERNQSSLIAEALQNYLDLNEWQVREILQGIREANAGELLDHEEITRKWEAKLADSLDKEGQSQS